MTSFLLQVASGKHRLVSSGKVSYANLTDNVSACRGPCPLMLLSGSGGRRQGGAWSRERPHLLYLQVGVRLLGGVPGLCSPWSSSGGLQFPKSLNCCYLAWTEKEMVRIVV